MKAFSLSFLTAIALSFALNAANNSEAPYLTNVKQLTFSSMGFEKAGEAYFAPDGKSIAFQAVPKGEECYQIYTMKLDEGIPRRISTGKGACTCAYFRPDGEKIIFASSHDDPTFKPQFKKEPVVNQQYKWDLTPYMNIYESNLDGSDLTPLTSGPAYHAECAYSPDGSRIVYASNEDGSMNIYSMNADGSNVKQLTHTSNCYNGGPFFSPDGGQIVFRADKERPHYLQVYLMNVEGSDEQQITNNQAVNWAPYWHPNGRVIAYTTSLHGHHQYQIYLVNTDTGAYRRLTQSDTFEGLPTFNREGTKILWTSKRSSDKSCQVFVADFTMPAEMN